MKTENKIVPGPRFRNLTSAQLRRALEKAVKERPRLDYPVCRGGIIRSPGEAAAARVGAALEELNKRVAKLEKEVAKLRKKR